MGLSNGPFSPSIKACRPNLLNGLTELPDRSTIMSSLPSKDAADKLIAYFFENYNPALPARGKHGHSEFHLLDPKIIFFLRPYLFKAVSLAVLITNPLPFLSLSLSLSLTLYLSLPPLSLAPESLSDIAATGTVMFLWIFLAKAGRSPLWTNTSASPVMIEN